MGWCSVAASIRKAPPALLPYFNDKIGITNQLSLCLSIINSNKYTVANPKTPRPMRHALWWRCVVGACVASAVPSAVRSAAQAPACVATELHLQLPTLAQLGLHIALIINSLGPTRVQSRCVSSSLQKVSGRRADSRRPADSRLPTGDQIQKSAYPPTAEHSWSLGCLHGIITGPGNEFGIRGECARKNSRRIRGGRICEQIQIRDEFASVRESSREFARPRVRERKVSRPICEFRVANTRAYTRVEGRSPESSDKPWWRARRRKIFGLKSVV